MTNDLFCINLGRMVCLALSIVAIDLFEGMETMR